MREMSSQSINTNRRRSQFRGGETRIMKRALSSLLVFALVLTLLVPAFAFAADKTTEEKFNELKEKGLLNGVEDGSAALDRELTRAELAAILVRLFKLEPITGQSTFIDVPATHWAQKEGVIEAVAKAGFMGSTTTYSKTFSPDAKLTIAEVATVAVRALGLTVDQNAKIDGVQPWAAPYVDAALKAQVIKEATNYHANANRGILVDAAYTIYQAKLKPPVTDATKVESVSADNLLQVNVKFDGKVDATTATDATNYSINKGVVVKNAALSDDGSVVTLTLSTKDGEYLVNQEEYKLSFSGVKSTNGTVLSTSNYAFTPVDATLPVVQKVEALGNKNVKITFSEPVKKPSTAEFVIDGKGVVGNTDVAVNVVVLKLYSPLSNGEHKITVKQVEDYSTLKSLTSEHAFTVVEDKEAPTIAEVVSATFEQVTLKFSEPIDPATVKGSNVYWLQGSTKRTAGVSVETVADDTFTFDFTNNRIQYTTDLYVTGVKDYSGNTIASDTKIQVNPTLDRTQPEVLDVTVDSASSIVVKFSKRLDKDSATNVKNYVFKNSKGEEVNKSIGSKVATLDGKVVTITLNQPLSEGKSYTLEISGVQDATYLKNVMIPYTTTISVDDQSAPYVVGDVIRNAKDRTLIVTYNETMSTGDDGSVVLPEKYWIYVDENIAGLTKGYNRLPSTSTLNTSSDGKVVYITLPKSLESAISKISKLKVQLVKDAAGNMIKDLSQEVDVKDSSTDNTVVKSVYAYSNTEIRVTFDANILGDSLDARDFSVLGGTTELSVVNASVSGAVVYLTLDDADALNDDATFNGLEVNVVISDTATTSTPDGRTIAGTGKVEDKISASVKKVTTDTDTVLIQFNENIDLSDVDSLASDLTVWVDDARTLAFTTDIVKDDKGNTIPNMFAVKFDNPTKGTVRIAANAPYNIKDVIGNEAEEFDIEVYLP